MTDLEPVEPGAVVRRGAGRVVVPQRWPAARSPRPRTIVASGIRALATAPLLPVAALAVTAAAAVEAAVRVARLSREDARPGGRDAGDRGPASTWVHVSWTHVEIRRL